MKKLMIAAALFFACMAAQAQQQNNIVKNGNTFEVVKETSEGKGYTPTGYYFRDVDGQRYEIHTHTTQRGKNKGVTRCYVQRVSKETGKPYWKVIDVKPQELKED